MKNVRRRTIFKNNKIKDYLHFFVLIFILDILLVVSLTNTKSLALPDNGLKLEMLGNVNQVLSINSVYNDEGVKVTFNDEELSLDDIDYEVSNNINTKELGEYQVNYHITYDNKTYDLIRNVSVVDDIKPEIFILTSKVSRNSCGNNLSYYAIDNYDGIITDKVKVEEEGNRYKLTVSDAALNETVEYVDIATDINDYVLTLNGTFYVYVPLNGVYNETGVKVTNLCGKELKLDYVTEGSVDTTKAGTYTLKYSLPGVDAYQLRKVVVYDKYIPQNISSDEEKVVYLTFDDGPGAYTAELLDILKKYDVKATFFVTAQFTKYLPLLTREKEEGHVVALHSKTHNWNIYQSFETYYKDFREMNSIIEQYTGSKTNLFRFPGGGSNTISKGKSTGIMNYNASKMQELGYYYYDWNVDSEDAAGADSKRIYSNVTKGISSRNYSIVLMHDIKRPTINTIEQIIVYALDNGYTFKTLSPDAPTVHHHVNN